MRASVCLSVVSIAAFSRSISVAGARALVDRRRFIKNKVNVRATVAGRVSLATSLGLGLGLMVRFRLGSVTRGLDIGDGNCQRGASVAPRGGAKVPLSSRSPLPSPTAASQTISTLGVYEMRRRSIITRCPATFAKANFFGLYCLELCTRVRTAYKRREFK